MYRKVNLSIISGFFRHLCRIAICRHPDSLLLFLDFGQGHNIFFCSQNIEAIRNVLNEDIYYSYMHSLNGLLMG